MQKKHKNDKILQNTLEYLLGLETIKLGRVISTNRWRRRVLEEKVLESLILMRLILTFVARSSKVIISICMCLNDLKAEFQKVEKLIAVLISSGIRHFIHLAEFVWSNDWKFKLDKIGKTKRSKLK